MSGRKFTTGKRLLIGILALLALCSGCGRIRTEAPASRDAQASLRIVTTIFPPYDFARTIAGERAQVTMLLKPGVESHSYEPSPADIIAIEDCDLFIYNGGESDVWVDQLLESMDSPRFRVLKMMDCVDVLTEETVEGMQSPTPHEAAAAPEYDEHIWTSPKNVEKIAAAIAQALAELDSAGAALYRQNLAAYQTQLRELDQTFAQIVLGGQRKLILFGDRFPFRYFAEAYGLSYRAAFPGCSAEAEPSAKTVAYLIEQIRAEGIPNIFYIEFSNRKIADAVAEETGAVPLLFHSCHNLTPDELAQGRSYLSLMYQNAAQLKEALN